MLNKLRSFSKSKLATVLVGLIIIPFVFWGMGGVFQGGNTNNVAKIGNLNVSTKKFLDHINSIGLNPEIIKNNLEKNIINDLLNDLLAKKFIELEIKKLGLKIKDESLINIIKNNSNFVDDNKKFKRSKYEKFLIENNITAADFEEKLRKRQLEKMLFDYYGGGIKSNKFLVNKLNFSKNSSVSLKYINLDKIYKKKDEFSEDDVLKYIKKNKSELERNYVNFKFVKLNPQNLTNNPDYSEVFFEKIDELERNAPTAPNIKELMKEYKDIEIKEIKNFNKFDERDEFSFVLELIEQNKIQVIDNNDYFIILEIDKFEKRLPPIDDKFYNQIKDILYQQAKFNYNKNILNLIKQKKFNDREFNRISKNSNLYKNMTLNSIKDNKFFEINSVDVIYSLPVNGFGLVADEDNKIYLVKVVDINNKKMTDIDFENNSIEVIKKIKEEIYSSYDLYLNKAYKVEINYNALERINNFFR